MSVHRVIRATVVLVFLGFAGPATAGLDDFARQEWAQRTAGRCVMDFRELTPPEPTGSVRPRETAKQLPVDYKSRVHRFERELMAALVITFSTIKNIFFNLDSWSSQE